MKISPYRIHIPTASLLDLQERLARSRLPASYETDGWEYGTNRDAVATLLEHWTGPYSWREVESHLNSFDQFLMSTDTDCIHFFHLRHPGARRAIVLTHGWPGSSIEFLELGTRLASPPPESGVDYEPFDVVIPSLPGFGFSKAPTQPGTNMQTIARHWHELMQALGYNRYFVHGGDIGAGVSTWIARLYPEAVIGLHLNYIPGSYQPFVGTSSHPLTEAELSWQKAQSTWQEVEGAYAHLQRTKPMSLAYGLTDSPIALAAWIMEKFHSWSDCQGDLFGHISIDALITNICCYWFSQNTAATLRLYRENSTVPLQLAEGEQILPPLSFAHFPKEIGVPPKEWVRRGYNLVRWTSMGAGGHFPALEAPAALSRDILEAFQE